MKYLSHYIEAKQTELFKKAGAFFAFSQAQYNEQAVPGITYVSLGAGMLCPKENVGELTSGLDKIVAEGIAQDLAENGAEKIIERELHNHEAFYVGEITDTAEALAAYGITVEQILATYNRVAPTIEY